MEGRPLAQVGAHVQGHNTGTIGISLLGGHGGSAKDKFSDHFTVMQRAALLKLIDGLETQYPTIKKVSGHNQYAAKACPCFNVPKFMSGVGVELERTSPVQSTTVQGIGLADRIWRRCGPCGAWLAVWHGAVSCAWLCWCRGARRHLDYAGTY